MCSRRERERESGGGRQEVGKERCVRERGGRRIAKERGMKKSEKEREERKISLAAESGQYLMDVTVDYIKV